MLFLHPHNVLAFKSSQVFPSDSFQKIQQKNAAFSDDSQNQDTFFYTDVDLDDDEEMSFSARKKISFDGSVFSSMPRNTLDYFSKILKSKICLLYFYYLPPSHFISLRVFRL